MWGADRDGGYGWVSIALHWLTAAAILVLLFAGDSIGVVGGEALSIHTTIGVCAWAMLALRVGWRLHQGHPPRAPGQGVIAFRLGFAVHYILLGAIGLMLVSGPLAGWSSGRRIAVFGLTLPGAAPSLQGVYEYARVLHIIGATTLGVGALLHVAGVLKHMFIDRDQTFDRIMVPPARKEAG